MKFLGSILAALTVLVFAATAGADVTWLVSASSSDGSALDGLTPGADVTIDITLRNTGSLSGLHASLFGYDANVMSVTGGSLPSYILAESAFGPGVLFGGIENSTTVLVESQGPNGAVTELFAGETPQTGGSTGSGALDFGVESGVQGEAQFRIVMRRLSLAGTVVTIGVSAENGEQVLLSDGSLGTSYNAVIPINPIPEPGTALLLGIGLAGLASSGRRG